MFDLAPMIFDRRGFRINAIRNILRIEILHTARRIYANYKVSEKWFNHIFQTQRTLFSCKRKVSCLRNVIFWIFYHFYFTFFFYTPHQNIRHFNFSSQSSVEVSTKMIKFNATIMILDETELLYNSRNMKIPIRMFLIHRSSRFVIY